MHFRTKLGLAGGLVGCVALLSVGATSALAINGPFTLTNDALLCYKGKVNKDLGSAQTGKGITVDLDDSDTTDGDRTFTAGGVRGSCNVASVGGGAIVNSGLSSVPHKIKGDKLDAKHVPALKIVTDQFGTFSLLTNKPDRYLSIAVQGDSNILTIPAFGSHTNEAYKCFKVKAVKDTPKFPKGVQATVVDAYNGSKLFDIKKQKLLCFGVGTNAEVVKDPLSDLVCYQAKPAKGESKHVSVTGEYFDDVILSSAPTIDTKKEELVCVPAISADAGDEFCGNDSAEGASGEVCDGDDVSGCTGTEVCADDCAACTLCGNGIIDGGDGETCELDSDCGDTEVCDSCVCAPRPALGARSLTINSAGSNFLSSFLGGASIGTMSGTIDLTAGVVLNSTGAAPLGVAGTTYFATDVSLGAPQRICYEVKNCTGEIYCGGGENADTSVVLDSLAVAAGACSYDVDCPDGVGNACCANACEGVGVGSGNSGSTTANVGVSDSGAGAAQMLCEVRVKQNLTINVADCSLEDYSAEDLNIRGFSTSASSTTVTSYCAGGGSPASTEPLFFPGAVHEAAYTTKGVNFDCSDFTSSDGPGTFLVALPAEEASALLTGDAANGLVLAD